MTKTMLEGAPNFRDVGGYSTQDGGVIRSGVVFRSGHLADLTDDDVETVGGAGIKTIIDFRPERERELSGYDVVMDGVDYVSIPIGDPAMAPHVYRALQDGDFSALPDIEVANRTLIRDCSSQLGEALRIISNPANLPVVIHCIGGKDRTGMTAALLLTLLGVPWPTVRDDYLRSNARLGSSAADQDAFISRLAKRAPSGVITEENRLALRRFFVLDPAYLDAAWDEIGLVAGSFDRYVEGHLKLSAGDITSLRSMLVDRSSE
jgi:protein-tyrosine phosphatase